MSAAPTDYPPAVLEEAEQAMVAASSGLEYPSADLAGAQAYADVLARYTLSQSLAADALTDTEPPVDEDALAEARAFERGLREGFERAIRDGAAHLREIGDEKGDAVVIAAGDWLEEWGASHSPTDRPSEYERGRADAIRDAAAWLRSKHYSAASLLVLAHESSRLATKQGAVSS